jgi:general nucleoside transport system permease protein
MNEELIRALGSIVANATPLVIAATGETITERAGVINLSIDGSLMLAAVLGFAAAWTAQQSGMPESLQLLVGIVVAMLVGVLVALLIAFSSIKLRRDQVAVGFVLTLLAADLAQFLGQDYTRIPGPQIPRWHLPLLKDIPVLGPIFFQHNILVYISFILLVLLWFWMFQTHGGLAMRAIGERPESAYARGTKVNLQRYLYTIIGGALVGLAGAAYSLNVKPGWASPPSMQGDGWIVLAIVIFGGWHPFRVVFGAYLLAALRIVSQNIQSDGLIIFGQSIEFNFVLLNGLPWILMIITLLLVSSGGIERLTHVLPSPVVRRIRAFLRSDPPKALGTRFDPE